MPREAFSQVHPVNLLEMCLQNAKRCGNYVLSQPTVHISKTNRNSMFSCILGRHRGSDMLQLLEGGRRSMSGECGGPGIKWFASCGTLTGPHKLVRRVSIGRTTLLKIMIVCIVWVIVRRHRTRTQQCASQHHSKLPGKQHSTVFAAFVREPISTSAVRGRFSVGVVTKSFLVAFQRSARTVHVCKQCASNVVFFRRASKMIRSREFRHKTSCICRVHLARILHRDGTSPRKTCSK